MKNIFNFMKKKTQLGYPFDYIQERKKFKNILGWGSYLLGLGLFLFDHPIFVYLFYIGTILVISSTFILLPYIKDLEREKILKWSDSQRDK